MTIKEIARLANVSVSTVSKIMNQKDGSISSETRERVLKIVRDYHYAPAGNIGVRAKSFCIGVLLAGQESMDMTVNGILAKVQERGYTLLVCVSNHDSETELKQISALCKHHVEGLLWEPLNGESLANKKYLEEKRIPYYLFHSSLKGSLCMDYEKLGYRAAQTLIDCQHRGIACLIKEGKRTKGFLDGYKRCLFDNQVSLDEEFIFHEITPLFIQKIRSHSVSAVLCSHYGLANKLYETLMVLHYQLPGDISLLSLKDDSRDGDTFPRISSLHVPNEKFGRYLGEKIIAEIEKEPMAVPDFMEDSAPENRDTIGIPYDWAKKHMVVVGSINIDIYLNVQELPNTRRTVTTSVSTVYPGGKGINQAVGSALLENKVYLIGNVGADADSDIIYKAARDYGVIADGVRRCMDRNTGKAYIFVEKGGDSMISILQGANGILSAKDIEIQEHMFKNAACCMIQTEIPIDAVEAACRISRANGVRTILKPSACGKLEKSLLACVNIIVPNKEELDAICPGKEELEKKAEYLLNSGVEAVVVTLENEGCYLKTHKMEGYFASAGFQAVDSTGACDAFISAMASYLHEGYDIERAVRIANYALGFCTSREGVVPALVDKVTLEAYIKQKESDLIF